MYVVKRKRKKKFSPNGRRNKIQSKKKLCSTYLRYPPLFAFNLSLHAIQQLRKKKKKKKTWLSPNLREHLTSSAKAHAFTVCQGLSGVVASFSGYVWYHFFFLMGAICFELNPIGGSIRLRSGDRAQRWLLVTTSFASWTGGTVLSCWNSGLLITQPCFCEAMEEYAGPRILTREEVANTWTHPPATY